MYYFRDRPWASIVHFKLLWCFKLLLVSKLRVWCLAMVTVLDIPNEGDWWVRDRLLPAFPWCGGLWFFCDRSQLFPSEGDRWNCFAVHSCALFSRWLVGFEIKLTWYFLSEHGSETRHGKDQSLARSSEVRVYLWSECSGVVTDTLTLFRWL